MATGACTRVGKVELWLTNCWRLSVDKLFSLNLQGGPLLVDIPYFHDFHSQNILTVKKTPHASSTRGEEKGKCSHFETYPEKSS